MLTKPAFIQSKHKYFKMLQFKITVLVYYKIYSCDGFRQSLILVFSVT